MIDNTGNFRMDAGYAAGGAGSQCERDCELRDAWNHRESQLFDDPDGGRVKADS